MATAILNPVHDAKIIAGASNVAWATFIAHNGSSAVQGGGIEPLGIDSGVPLDTWFSEYVGLFAFDLGTALPPGATINAATIRFFIQTETVAFDLALRVVLATPTNPLNIVAADYAQMGITALSTDYTHAGVTVPAYNDKVLNATGIAAVQAASEGVITIALRVAEVVDNAEPGFISATFGGYDVLFSEAGDPPELEIDYDAPPAPTVLDVSPANGPAAGGTPVTITGTDFVSGATVTFDGVPATGVVFNGATELEAVTPAHPAGLVDVVVTNPDLQIGTLVDGYTYDAAPTVTLVAPPSGPYVGATPVTISGTGFVSGATVTFDGVPATSVVFVNDTTLTAVTPAGAIGAVDVVVTNPDLQIGTLVDGYSYVGFPPPPPIPPAVVRVTVGELPRAQGRRAVVLRAGNVDGPTLTAGVFTIATGFSNLHFASVGVRAGAQLPDRVLELLVTFSAGTVTVTVRKQQLSATNTWGNAVTADVAAAIFDWTAYGS